MRSQTACRFHSLASTCFLFGWLVIYGRSASAQFTPQFVPQIDSQLTPKPGENASACETRSLASYTESALRPGGGTVYTLTDLIDRAEKQNPDAKGAWESLQSAAALAGIARSALFPTLALSGYALKGDTLFGLPPNVSAAAVIKLSSNILEAGLQASYSGDFGTTLNEYRAAKHFLASQKASLNQTNQKVALDVSTKYYDYITAKDSRRKAQANEDDSCLTLKESEEELRTGLASVISLRAARAKFLDAHASTLNAVAKEANAKIGLAALLGLTPQQSFDVAPLSDAPPVRFLGENVEALQQHALATSPKIVESEEGIQAAHALVKAEVEKYFPTFKITAQKSYTDSTSLTDMGAAMAAQAAGSNSHGFTYLYAGSFKFNLFDGGETHYSVKAARATERQLRDKAEKTRLQVEQDVSKSYNDVLYAILNQDAAAEALEASKEVWDAANISKANGLASDLDFSKARLAYISAQATYTEARADLLKDATQLASDAGDLLSTGAESPERIELKP